MVIVQIKLKGPPQRPLVPDDDMVQALPPDRSDHALDERILPRGVWRTHDLLDPETAQRVTECRAIDRIPISEQILWRSNPGKRLADLLPRPGGGWMVSDGIVK